MSAALLALLLLQGAASEPRRPTRSELAAARDSYDLDAAQELLERALATPESPAKESTARLSAEIFLLVAELLRIQFEETPENERATRRGLGERIDEAAEHGLARLADSPASSEDLRLRADLVGTMIRSKFRGKMHRGKMEAAAQEAIELDPRNARAWVSLAKPLIFAPGRNRADLEAALGHLDKAQAIDGELEPARLLRGRVLAELGREEEAVAEWEAALRANPVCSPARDLLERHRP